MLNEAKLAKIKEFIELSKSSLTEEEFVSAFKKVIDYIKAMQAKNKAEMESLDSKYTEIVNSIKNNYGDDIAGMKQEAMDYCLTEIGKITKRVDAKMAEVKDGVDGLSADVNEVARISSDLAITAIKPLIPTVDAIEADLPKLGAPIRDSLELLQGDERLDKSAIKGLEEEFERLREIRGRVLGGGGFSTIAMQQHFIYKEVPVDSGDHLTFTINHAPSPANSFRLVRSRAEQNVTEDYTLTGKTLVLTLAYDSTTESLFCDYMI